MYRAKLICRRCAAVYMVCRLTEVCSYWFCHNREDGRRCGTFNTWKEQTL